MCAARCIESSAPSDLCLKDDRSAAGDIGQRPLKIFRKTRAAGSVQLDLKGFVVTSSDRYISQRIVPFERNFNRALILSYRAIQLRTLAFLLTTTG
jgi:hypothetical protein